MKSNQSPRPLNSLSSVELNKAIKRLTKEERRITLEVLHHLAEIENRRLHSELGYPSLFAYSTSELKHSDSAANRRIHGMRALKENREIENKIESGELSLSVIAQARAVIRAHEKETGVPVAIERKSKIYQSLPSETMPLAIRSSAVMARASLPLSSLQPTETAQFYTTAGEVREPTNGTPAISRSSTITSVARINPRTMINATSSIHATTERALSNGITRVTMEFSEDEMAVMNELKLLRSAQGKRPDLKAILLKLAHKEVQRRRKERGLSLEPSGASV